MDLEKDGDERKGRAMSNPIPTPPHPVHPSPHKPVPLFQMQSSGKEQVKKIDYLKGFMIISYLLRSLAPSSLISLPLTPHQAIWPP